MAGFGTNRKIPGAKDTPVHGAFADAQRMWDQTGGQVVDQFAKTTASTLRSAGDVAGGINRGAQEAFEGGASMLRDVGHDLFGGLFGGSSPAPPSISPARPMTQPSRITQQASPVSPARPLVVAPKPTAMWSAQKVAPKPITSGSAQQKRVGKRASKRRKSNK